VSSLLGACSSGESGELQLSDARPYSCPECGIALDTVAVLCESDSVQFLEQTRAAYIPAARKFVVGPTTEPGRVAIFDSAGGFERYLLRRGGGPGELQDVRWIAPFDSLALVAGSAGDFVITNLVSGAVFSGRLPAGLIVDGIGFMGQDRLLVHSVRPGRPEFWVGDVSGATLNWLGEEVRTPGPNSPYDRAAHSEVFGLLDNDIIFSISSHYEWAARILTPQGEVHGWNRRPAWFQEYSFEDLQQARGLLPTQVRPLPAVLAVIPCGIGLQWVFAVLPDEKWAQADESTVGLVTVDAAGNLALPDRNWDSFLDGYVELVDPGSRTVIAGSRLPYAPAWTVGPGLVGRVDRLPGTIRRIVVEKPRLVTAHPPAADGCKQPR
jgi:hypothetical protein